MIPELTVLIVEDDPHMRLGCVQAMQLAGLPVQAVASAEEAEPHLHGRKPAEWLKRLEEERTSPGGIVITDTAAEKPVQGKIVAVNSGWNFVVLNVGDQQGVLVNAPLLVVRGNVPVARLRVTSVERATSVADVIPASTARGVTVQPGDTVIFEGRSAATEAGII